MKNCFGQDIGDDDRSFSAEVSFMIGILLLLLAFEFWRNNILFHYHFITSLGISLIGFSIAAYRASFSDKHVNPKFDYKYGFVLYYLSIYWTRVLCVSSMFYGLIYLNFPDGNIDILFVVTFIGCFLIGVDADSPKSWIGKLIGGL